MEFGKRLVKLQQIDRESIVDGRQKFKLKVQPSVCLEFGKMIGS